MKVSVKSKAKGVQIMEIDEEDFDKIKHLNLRINYTSNKNTFYCISTVYKNCKYIKTLHIHRIIMGLGDYNEDKRIINHKDGNGLNNKKENLEICDTMYNCQSIRKPNVQPAKVSFEPNTEKTKRKKQWCFQMTVNKKRHRKRFFTKEEAEEYRKNFISNL